MKKRSSDSLRKYIYKFFLKNIPATVYTNIFIRKRKDMIMKIYVKSAGFSIDQDYSWIDEAGKNISPDASILAYNVSDIQFVWKSTSGSIYLFCNAFTDPNRTDLYNRPLRNYMLLTGDTEEAALLSDCFAKMLLDQKNFEAVLNSSVQNAGGDSKAGFCVDFKKLSAYFDSSFPYCIHAQKLKRFVYERDSSQARQNLLNELWWIQSRPATLLIHSSRQGIIRPQLRYMWEKNSSWFEGFSETDFSSSTGRRSGIDSICSSAPIDKRIKIIINLEITYG